MQIPTTRLVIYAKDVQLITGRCKRSAHELLRTIKRFYGKGRAEFVTVEEFCVYTGLREEEVGRYLK